MEDPLIDGDEDEAEVVVEGPLESVGLVVEGDFAGSLLEETGADQSVDG